MLIDLTLILIIYCDNLFSMQCTKEMIFIFRHLKNLEHRREVTENGNGKTQTSMTLTVVKARITDRTTMPRKLMNTSR